MKKNKTVKKSSRQKKQRKPIVPPASKPDLQPLALDQAEKSWIETGLKQKKEKGLWLEVFILKSRQMPGALKKSLKKFEIDEIQSSSETAFKFLREDHVVYVKVLEWKKSSADLAESEWALARNSMGALFAHMSLHKTCQLVKLEMEDARADIQTAILLGLDLAAYKYWERVQEAPLPWSPALQITSRGRALKPSVLQAAAALGRGMNLARHLVNLPPNLLNPESYQQALEKLFQKSTTVKMEVWNESRLKAEGMGLILAVGSAAEHSPRLIHLKYRPKSSSKKPIALVGKGITFDSGGLDIKPANFMRWMKKDMGGSASVVGTLRWAELVGLKVPLDVYLPLAENAVSQNSFRPGDVIVGRNGKSVEIHNTDAEGRLVLADAFDVAVTQKGSDMPTEIIDVATLTGAIKASLGAQVAGLFSNNEKLRDQLYTASLKTNDHCWPMPLFHPYSVSLASPVADYANCSDAMGGAVTAALFLEKYVRDLPWAHFDIYAFVDSPVGCFREKGGNGQCVQLLSHYLSQK